MTSRDDYIDELLSAYLDGALTPDEAARAEHLLRTDESHRQALEELRSLRRELGGLPQYQLPADFHERVIAQVQLQGVSRQRVTTSGTPRAISSRHSTWKQLALVAASLAASGLLAIVAYHRISDSPTDVAIIAEQDPQDEKVSPTVPPERPERVRPHELAVEERSAELPMTVPDLVAPPEPAESAIVAAPPDRAETTVETPEPAREAIVQGRQLDSVWPELNAFVGQQPEAVVQDDGKLVFVVHLTLTQAGVRNRTFERVLQEHGIWLDEAIPLDKRMEKMLLDARFIALADQQASEHKAGVGLVYVEATGLQIDFATRELAAMPNDVQRIQYDFTRKPSELDVFRQLHRDTVERAEREAVLQPAGVVDRGGPRMRTLPRGSARPIVLSDAPSGTREYVGMFSEPVAAPEGADFVPMMIDIVPAREEEVFIPVLPMAPVDEHQVGLMNPQVHTLFVLKLAE